MNVPEAAIAQKHLHNLVLLSVAVMLTVGVLGCGTSEQAPTPPTPDIFEGLEAVGTDTTLEVMTWNIEHFAKQGEITVDHVIHGLRRMEVDIIGLQEIEKTTYFNRVVDELDGYSGFKASSASYDLDLAFIYRTDGGLEMTSIYEILSSHRREFPRRPLVFEGTFDGVPIVVINNHLKCCGDGFIDENEDYDEENRRMEACLLLDDYVKTHYADKRVFIIGDFNDELTDAAEANVFQNFLDDPEHWEFVDMAIAEGSRTGWSYPTWPSHIDHILITDELFDPMKGPEAETRVMPLNEYLNGWVDYDSKLSDHLPVYVKLKP